MVSVVSDKLSGALAPGAFAQEGEQQPRTEQELATWTLALKRLSAESLGERWAAAEYCDALSWLLSLGHIPTKRELERWLAPTGWTIAYTHGYLEVGRYQRYLRDRICPIAWRLRRYRDLDHSAAPDFLHDVVGHLPFLFNENYSRMLSEWGRLGSLEAPTSADREVCRALGALIDSCEQDSVDIEAVRARTFDLRKAHGRALSNISKYARLEMFYTWAIEFGVLQDAGCPKLVGAAALSSRGELERFKRGLVALVPFRGNALTCPVDYTKLQNTFFVARDFQEYLAELYSM